MRPQFPLALPGKPVWRCQERRLMYNGRPAGARCTNSRQWAELRRRTRVLEDVFEDGAEVEHRPP